MILEAADLVAGYGTKQVLHGVSLRIGAGEIVALIGHNGAGKTTLLKTLFGLLPVRGGEVRYAGRPITGRRAALNVRDGLSFVPQGHGIFTDLTVGENLELGGYSVGAAEPERLAAIYDLFPILKERRDQRAGTLSGGQQQMLALGLALVLRPKLLLLDEPSLGLAPQVVDTVFQVLRQIREDRKSVV